jgi:hypothetical protein
MSLFDLSKLTEFTGTERYYRISHKHLLTEGTKFLANQAQSYWMMDAIASHLSEIGTADWFVVVKITVKDAKALVIAPGHHLKT